MAPNCTACACKALSCIKDFTISVQTPQHWCYNDSTTYPVLNSDQNKWWFLTANDACADMRPLLINKQRRLCKKYGIFISTCPYELACDLERDQCSDGSMWQETNTCLLLPQEYRIATLVFIPLVWLLICFIIVLIILRRNYFPLKIKDTWASILHLINLGLMVTSFEFMWLLPCPLFFVLFSFSSPFHSFFMISRVCKKICIFFNNT